MSPLSPRSFRAHNTIASEAEIFLISFPRAQPHRLPSDSYIPTRSCGAHINIALGRATEKSNYRKREHRIIESRLPQAGTAVEVPRSSKLLPTEEKKNRIQTTSRSPSNGCMRSDANWPAAASSQPRLENFWMIRFARPYKVEEILSRESGASSIASRCGDGGRAQDEGQEQGAPGSNIGEAGPSRKKGNL